MKENEMPPAVKTGYQDLVKETKIPIWNFVGLALFAISIMIGSYTSGETAKLEAEYLKAPEKGDLYQIEMDGDYTTFRVVDVNNDSLLVTWNNYGVTKAAGLYKIEKDENYGEPVSIARTALAGMKEKKKIYHIVRSSKQAGLR